MNLRHFFQHLSCAKHWYKNLKILVSFVNVIAIQITFEMSNSFGISGSFCKTNPFQNAYLNIAELSHVTQSFLLEISPAAYFSMHFFVVYFLQLSLIGRKSHVKKDYPKIAKTERHSYRKLKICILFSFYIHSRNRTSCENHATF